MLSYLWSMTMPLTPAELRICLEWQVELGVDETIAETPVDRYALEAVPPRPAPAAVTAPVNAPAPPPPSVDPVAVARAAAGAAGDLNSLRAAMAAYEHCDLKKGARNLVFSDGHPEARVMIIGEAPGRNEDIQGKPFVGPAGQLLDRMLTAIGLDRTSTNADQAVYIANVLPWRPAQNRDPKPEEMAMMVPFLERHVELVAPMVIVLMGNAACQAVLGRRGITRLRGDWTTGFARPTVPMFHPAYLLRNPAAKREAWADLLALRAHLDTGTP